MGIATHRPELLPGKRKAILRRRGLFDFVSPFIVGVAALSYLLFTAFVLYSRWRLLLGSDGLLNLGVITLVYSVQASVVYTILRGKKPNPLEAHAERERTIGLVVKSCVYSCIACIVFRSLNVTIVMLDLRRWEPFALTAFLVTTALLSLMGIKVPPRSTDPLQT